MILGKFITFSDGPCTYILQTTGKRFLGRVVRLTDQDKAMDFNCKQVAYPISKVEGLNIFIVPSGDFDKANHEPCEGIINEMADFYLTTINSNKQILKRYRTKW